MGSNLQILFANWKKYPCQFHWQRGFLALAIAVRLGYVGFDRSKLNSIAKAKKLFVSETGFRFCAIDSQISFFSFGACIQKKYPKLSVKLAQSGRDLAQSVKHTSRYCLWIPQSMAACCRKIINFLSLHWHCLLWNRQTALASLNDPLQWYFPLS